eukprot:gene7413-7477_t
MPDVTLKKLAEMLNLSISTVSRALKNHPDISDDTKIKVKELSVILDYEPNTYAINLRTNNSKEFGIIIPSISNDFYQSFISSLEEEARLYGYSLIILQSGEDPVVEIANLKRCKQNRMAGIFVSITSKTTDIDQFLKLGEYHIPVIFFDKVPAYEACNKVCVDDSAAAALTAEALINRKKKKILAIFGNPNMSITHKRLPAFKNTFLKYGSDAMLDIVYAHSTAETVEITMDRLKNQQDIGLIAISDGIVPGFYHPEITYIETSGFKLAKMAFSRMLACVAGSTYVQELKIDSVLVEQGSL